MSRGKLTVAQVFDILDRQAMERGMFGQIALKLGFLSKDDLQELLELQSELTPTMADALIVTGVITAEEADDGLRPPSRDAANTDGTSVPA
jgi:hypothetical protein